jgi:hypothetical protein
MTDEELLHLEREGARIAKRASEAFAELAAFTRGNRVAAAAVMTGYLRASLQGMGLSPDEYEEHVVLLCSQFAPEEPELVDLILDRLDGQTSKGDAS